MTHLSPAEFVEAAERTLPPPRAGHLERCERCRTSMADVRAALDAAQAVDVPEPSPLYWQHLSANVRDRVASETIVPAWRAAWREAFSMRALVPIGSALALVAAVIVAGELTHSRPVPRLTETAAAVHGAAADPAVEPDDTDVWEVLTSAAAEVPIEEAHDAGMGVTWGAIDRAVQRMSPEELNELGHLLQSQLHGSGD
jgi:hypothetical protein